MPNHECADRTPETDAPRWQTPQVEVISLSCEISAYAPDGEPLF